jgi:Cytochrome C''.
MRVITTGLIVSLLSAPVFAGDLEDQIAFRKGYWQVVKHEFGDVMAAMVREKRPMDVRAFRRGCRAFERALHRLRPRLFLEGSVSDDSRALPKDLGKTMRDFADALSNL